MNPVIVQLRSLSGYLSSGRSLSGYHIQQRRDQMKMRVDVHDLTSEVVKQSREKRSFTPVVDVARVMEKKVYICCFPLDAFSYLATHFMRSIPMKGS